MTCPKILEERQRTMPKGAPPPYDCQAPDTERRTKKRPLSTIGGDQQHIHFVGKARAINVTTSVEV